MNINELKNESNKINIEENIPLADLIDTVDYYELNDICDVVDFIDGIND